MKIYLLRHAKAEIGFPDSGRNLSELGRTDAGRLGSFLRERGGIQLQNVWTSPLLRAQETANIFLQALQPEGNKEWVEQPEDLLEPERDPRPLIESIRELDQDLLLVGHNPNLETLFSLLISGERYRARIHLKTCVLVCLEWLPWLGEQQTGPCVLQWLLDPRLIAAE
ncbi:MAG: SixA phosphatase family protein [Coraliomargaritaceae bacterium]